MIHALWMPTFAGMTILSTSSLAAQDESPAYINALATYAESKAIDDGGFERIIEGCNAGKVTNPISRELARESTDKLLAFETLQDYIDNAEMDADRVCIWAKKAQTERQQQHKEREKTREDTAELYELNPPQTIAAGDKFTCVIDSDQRARCWGGDYYRGKSIDPTNAPEDLGPIMSIAANDDGICAIKLSGTARCWGSLAGADLEQLGKLKRISVKKDYVCVVDQAYSPIIWKSGELRNVEYAFGKTVAIAANDFGVCALSPAFEVKCLLLIAVPEQLPAARHMSFGRSLNCLITLEDKLFCGRDNPEWADLETVSLVSVGDHFACAVLKDNSVRCFGSLHHPYSELYNPPSDLGPVREVVVGGQHACAILFDNQVHCWGVSEKDEVNVPLGLKALDRSSQ